MRRVSKKRQRRNREVQPVREALIAKHGKCMICWRIPGHGWRSDLCCNEICRGPNRDAALDKPYAILVLCERCHMDYVHGESWSEIRQLALLRERAPDDYDLAAYNRLVNENAPNRITEEEIDDYCNS